LHLMAKQLVHVHGRYDWPLPLSWEVALRAAVVVVLPVVTFLPAMDAGGREVVAPSRPAGDTAHIQRVVD
jgi:hypothetical protein